MGFASDAPAPAPESQEATLALWLAPPRARSEVAREDGNRLAVVDGDRWWSHDPHFGALTNDGDPHHQAGVGEELRALLDPALMIPFVDAERGVLLRLESRIEGAPLIVTELLELAFDEDFPADTFTFSSPDGLAPRRFDGVFGAREDLPLHEAARRAPFAAVAPSLIPEGTELMASYSPGGDHRGMTPSLHLSYPHRTHGLSITEGTRVFMVSQGLDGAALLDVAASLERASQDPPLLRRAS